MVVAGIPQVPRAPDGALARQKQLPPSSAHWFGAPEIHNCPLQVPELVVQTPGVPGMTLVPRHTQVLPAWPQVPVPTSQAPPQTIRVVVVDVVVVVVVVGGAGHSPTKLKGLSFLSCFRLFLPISPWETQLTQVVAVQVAGLVPGQRQKGFLPSVRTWRWSFSSLPSSCALPWWSLPFLPRPFRSLPWWGFPFPFLASARAGNPADTSAPARTPLTVSRRLGLLKMRATRVSKVFASVDPPPGRMAAGPHGSA